MLSLGNATNFGTSVDIGAITYTSTSTHNGTSIAVLWRCECIQCIRSTEVSLNIIYCVFESKLPATSPDLILARYTSSAMHLGQLRGYSGCLL